VIDLRTDSRARDLLVVALAVLLYASWASVVSLPAWIGLVACGLAAFEATVSRRIGSGEAVSVRTFRFAELVMAALLAEAGALLLIGPSSLTWSQLLLDPAALGLLVIMWVTWLWVRATLVDFEYMGALVAAQTTVGTARLGQRLRIGMALAVAGAALSVATPRVLLDLDRQPIGGLVWTAPAFIGLAWWILTQARLAHEREAWRRAGVRPDPNVVSRWTSLSIWVLVTAAVGAWLLPNGSGALSRLPAATLAAVGAIGQRFLDWLASRADEDARPVREIPNRSAEDIFGPNPGNELPPPPVDDRLSDAFAWIGNVLIWVLTIAAVSLAIFTVVREREAIKAAFRSQGGLLRVILLISAAMLATLVSVLRWMVGWWPRRQAAGEPAIDTPGAAAVRHGWVPGDRHRSVIAAAYHRFLELAAPVVGLKDRSETPIEYAQGAARAAPPVADEVAGLTDLFVEARWSDHPPADAAARHAQEYLGRIDRFFTEDPPD